mgnify:CR=1
MNCLYQTTSGNLIQVSIRKGTTPSGREYFKITDSRGLSWLSVNPRVLREEDIIITELTPEDVVRLFGEQVEAPGTEDEAE